MPNFDKPTLVWGPQPLLLRLGRAENALGAGLQTECVVDVTRDTVNFSTDRMQRCTHVLHRNEGSTVSIVPGRFIRHRPKYIVIGTTARSTVPSGLKMVPAWVDDKNLTNIHEI
ncbi:hypothetical protein VTK26DRAFT_830 [Humicola hyalothermophila]